MADRDNQTPGDENASQGDPSGTRRETGSDSHGFESKGGSPLIEQGIEDWEACTPEFQKKYIEHIETFYQAIAKEFLEHADICVEKFASLNRSYGKSRIRLIWLTGVLAGLNVIIAFVSSSKESGELSSEIFKFVAVYLPVVAALWAAVLAVLSNVDSFHKYLERAQAFKEARELFLDTYREFEMLWQTNVYAFCVGPAACVNASRLYKRIVARDKEIRGYVKELTAKDEK